MQGNQGVGTKRAAVFTASLKICLPLFNAFSAARKLVLSL
jgi:hypothetical protein